MLTIYGIKNCDTCRKARRWLKDQGIPHRFHDLREDGIDDATLRAWLSAIGTDALVNRRSTTWRQLAAGDRAAVSPDEWVQLLSAHPTLIKRPVFATGNAYLVGFSEPEKITRMIMT